VTDDFAIKTGGQISFDIKKSNYLLGDFDKLHDERFWLCSDLEKRLREIANALRCNYSIHCEDCNCDYDASVFDCMIHVKCYDDWCSLCKIKKELLAMADACKEEKKG
jgi:hypothetical protein